MAHVLIGFAEALPAPEVVFSLIAAGHRVSAFGRSDALPLKALPLTALHVIPAPETDTKAACAALNGLMTGDDAPDLILPLDDTGLWLANAALGETPRSAGATGQPADVALDKEAQVAAALRAGLPVPQTIVVKAPADLDQPLPFPSIAKPALAIRADGAGLGKGETTYLPDRTAAEALRDRLGPGMEPLLVQPLVHGVGEGVFGYAHQGVVHGWSGHRRVRMMNPHGSGSSACAAAPPSQDLQTQITAFLADIGWQGPFMVELLRDADGTPWFMELNGRMWGSLALARRQGLEYPAWAVAARLEDGWQPPVVPDRPAPRIQRNLGREILHLLFVIRGPKSAFHRETWPKLMTSLGGVLRPAPLRNFYNYDPAHRTFFLREAAHTVWRAVRR